MSFILSHGHLVFSPQYSCPDVMGRSLGLSPSLLLRPFFSPASLITFALPVCFQLSLVFSLTFCLRCWLTCFSPLGLALSALPSLTLCFLPEGFLEPLYASVSLCGLSQPSRLILGFSRLCVHVSLPLSTCLCVSVSMAHSLSLHLLSP